MKRQHIDYLGLISQIADLMKNLDSPETLIEQVLKFLQEFGFLYAAVKISDPSTNEIIIRFSSGLSESEIQRGRYKIGEGITGSVIQNNKPVIIRNIATDSTFLNKTKSKGSENGSFFCFPLQIETRAVGVLTALSSECNGETFSEFKKLFEILIPLISQSVHFKESIKNERISIELENNKLRSELRGKKGIQNIIGKGSKMNTVFEQVRLVAPSTSTVLILGANGTGKELIADAIHYSSPRNSKPFIKINCAALPDNLLESELFGHERGAFTGAIQQKKGKFEIANGGTIFLDEIGELSMSLQAKLLRVLQAKEFERVGGLKTISSDVRIIAATNRILEEAILDGSFREDLYYRLNVFPIYLPKLKDRQTDILLLAEHFLEKYNIQNQKKILRISTPAINMLNAYHWPGNVRELENCIERAVLLTPGDTLRSQELPPTLQMHGKNIAKSYSDDWTLPQAVQNLETELIIEALKKVHGHQGKAAYKLGITERQMGYKISKYKISKYQVK
jgi:Nif-specific regulatory protein